MIFAKSNRTNIELSDKIWCYFSHLYFTLFLFSKYLINNLVSNSNEKHFHDSRSLSERKSWNVIKKLKQLKRKFLVYYKQNHFSPISHALFLSFFIAELRTKTNRRKWSFCFSLCRLLFTFCHFHLKWLDVRIIICFYCFGLPLILTIYIASATPFASVSFCIGFRAFQFKWGRQYFGNKFHVCWITVNIRMRNNAHLMLYPNFDLPLALSLHMCVCVCVCPYSTHLNAHNKMTVKINVASVYCHVVFVISQTESNNSCK